jgi:3-phenylpropionate/trans-cinnamate dioxygenase ferredoxin reductase subunit
MSTDNAMVIVGASLAGARAAETLRNEGFDGPVTLIGAEDETPYERPPLSKDYLMGKHGRDKLYVQPREWYGENNVDLRLRTIVTAVDPAAHEIVLDDDSRIGYSKLLLTTGSSPRRVPIPGADLKGVLYLREVQDSDRIRGAGGLVAGRSDRGGWIGLAPPAAEPRATGRDRAWMPTCRCCGCSGRGRRGLRRCTPTTGSTCARACGSPRSPVAGVRPTVSGSRTARTSTPMS